MNPKITVLMPVYNGEKYIKEAIDSILNQKFKDFELLIINDCSTDNSLEIIRSYNDERINVIENESNIGLSATLNKGLDIAKGQYIARMDQDDISHPQRLQKQVVFMEKNTEIGICGTWIKYFGELNFIAKYAKNHKKIINNMFTSCPFAHPSVIIRKNLFDKYNLRYNIDLKTGEDYDLWVRASKYLKFANIQEVLLDYRTSPSQMTKSIDELKAIDKQTWKMQLINLGIEITEEEFEMYYQLLTEKYNVTNAELFLQESTKLFDKIITANNQKQIYDTKHITKLFKNKWYIAFKNIPEFNIVEIFTNIDKFKYLTLKNKFRFIYRQSKNKFKEGKCI